MLSAVRGGLGFLTQIPVGGHRESWDDFRRTPSVFPVVGYVVGLLVAVPVAVGLPPSVTAVLFPVWLYLVTGINHVDGLADLGDTLAVHGDAERRQSVMTDTTVGVGAVLAVTLGVAGLASSGFALAGGGLTAVAIVLGAEVGAKLGMAVLACVGTATHEGLAAELTGELERRDVLVPGLLAVPAVFLPGRGVDRLAWETGTGLLRGLTWETPLGLVGWPVPAVAVSVLGALAGTAILWSWAVRTLGGVSGDVLGATNEIARLIGLHAGVVVWTLW